MSEYTLIILVQSILIFMWILFIKMKRSETPEFNSWLTNKLQDDPSLQFEEAFNEYIYTFNILDNEQIAEPAASAKLKLIEEYKVDEILEGDDSYMKFKKSLRNSGVASN